MTYKDKVSATVTRLTGRRAATPMQPIDAWPVNSIFFGYSTTNPNLLLGGGTWTRIAQGQMLIGQNPSDVDFDVLGDSGGEKAHALTVSELATHGHNVSNVTIPTREGDNITPKPNSGASAYTNANSRLAASGGTSGTAGDRSWLTGPVNDAGGGSAHNNMPPYLTVYIWRRTA